VEINAKDRREKPITIIEEPELQTKVSENVGRV